MLKLSFYIVVLKPALKDDLSNNYFCMNGSTVNIVDKINELN